MNIIQRFRGILTTFVLILVLTTTAAYSGLQAQQLSSNLPVISRGLEYAQLDLGNAEAGHDFGNWVVQTASGLLQGTDVRDNSGSNEEQANGDPQVRPASEDPYGDPADANAQQAKISPASEDPYGDPADANAQQAKISPASEDPYGDPADQNDTN
ncbi:MAG: hypothetical protein PUP91_21570 [Rhizonema sp. PD37]|nr:hypothetical protein [Rhizonema sp. PD37]